MDSIWTQTAELPRFAPLDRDLRTDVLIIDGGMAGVLCAYQHITKFSLTAVAKGCFEVYTSFSGKECIKLYFI